MGTNCAPELANLHCYVIESEWMDQHLDVSPVTNEFTYRFIDDILTFDAAGLPSPEEYGMAYSETTSPNGECVFLGMTLRQEGRLRMGVADKRDHFPWPVMRYPSAISNIPLHQGGGVMIGQLVRYGILCNNMTDFKETVQKLVTRLLERGHEHRTLVQAWNAYLLHRWEANHVRTHKLRSWFYRMLTWCCHRSGEGKNGEIPSEKTEKRESAKELVGRDDKMKKSKKKKIMAMVVVDEKDDDDESDEQKEKEKEAEKEAEKDEEKDKDKDDGEEEREREGEGETEGENKGKEKGSSSPELTSQMGDTGPTAVQELLSPSRAVSESAKKTSTTGVTFRADTLNPCDTPLFGGADVRRSPCPHCGKMCKGARGVQIHCARTHGESSDCLSRELRALFT